MLLAIVKLAQYPHRILGRKLPQQLPCQGFRQSGENLRRHLGHEIGPQG